jgi:prophage regulatory protein
MPGNLWTCRNALTPAENRKANHMRVRTDNESSERSAAQLTLQAAHLLQEALSLLRAGPPPLIAHTMKRSSDRLLRLPEVECLTGLCRSAIYEQMRKGAFPRSVKAGQRTTAWPESAVQSWIAERMNERTT